MDRSIAVVFLEDACKRCTVHSCRDKLACVPKSRRAVVVAVPKAIHAMEPRGAVEAKALAVAEELERMQLGKAARVSTSSGDVSTPTTPSCASIASSAGGPAWLAPSPTAD